MKAPLIECHACGGTGRQPLSDEMLATMLAIPKAGMHAAQVAEELRGTRGHSPNVTAINNRLEMLRELGFVTRERCGKFWIYRRAPKPAKP